MDPIVDEVAAEAFAAVHEKGYNDDVHPKVLYGAASSLREADDHKCMKHFFGHTDPTVRGKYDPRWPSFPRN